jgi:hypothetical protein
MLPLPSNALERSSAQAMGLISGYFLWIKSSGILCQDRPEIALDNSQFIDIVLAECLRFNGGNALYLCHTLSTQT